MSVTQMNLVSDQRRLDPETLHARLGSDNAPRVLDVRTPAEFENAHIAGSYNVPLDTLKEHRRELLQHLDQDVVLVCQSGIRSEQAEEALGEVGLPGLRVLDGGMAGWLSAGLPANRGRQTWDLERQVRLIAGGIVLSSVLGSVVVPKLKWVAAGVGTGLVGAAVTNTCTMGMLLSKAPWNQPKNAPDISEVFRALAEGA